MEIADQINCFRTLFYFIFLQGLTGVNDFLQQRVKFHKSLKAEGKNKKCQAQFFNFLSSFFRHGSRQCFFLLLQHSLKRFLLLEEFCVGKDPGYSDLCTLWKRFRLRAVQHLLLCSTQSRDQVERVREQYGGQSIKYSGIPGTIV